MPVVRHLHLAAATGLIRTASFHGRDHLVVPVVALVEGVIFPINAATPELVLAREFSLAPQGWNGRPVFPNHPVANGTQISGNSPKVLESRSFGQVFNSRVSGKRLLMEAWLDTDKALKVGEDAQEVIRRAQAGEPIEVSVGAFVVAEDKEGVFNGKPYKAIWHEITPDHLALLPAGVRGACSIDMGCGVRAAAAADEHPIHVITEDGVELKDAEEVGHPFHGNQWTSAEIDVTDHHESKRSAEKAGLKHELVSESGPGGGNPVVKVSGPTEKVRSYLTKHGYDPEAHGLAPKVPGSVKNAIDKAHTEGSYSRRFPGDETTDQRHELVMHFHNELTSRGYTASSQPNRYDSNKKNYTYTRGDRKFELSRPYFSADPDARAKGYKGSGYVRLKKLQENEMLRDARDISQATRDKLPKTDFAGPGTSYPIVKPVDVSNAAQAIGRATNPAAVKARIIELAYAKGAAFVAQLPDDWKRKSRTLRERLMAILPKLEAAVGNSPLDEVEPSPDNEVDDEETELMPDNELDDEESELTPDNELDDEESELTPDDEEAERRMAAGARHSAADMEMIQHIHDKAVSLGANCPSSDYEPDPELVGDENLTTPRSKLEDLLGKRHNATDQEMVQLMHDKAASLGAACKGYKAAEDSGHPFHGNQYTDGGGSGDKGASPFKPGLSRADMDSVDAHVGRGFDSVKGSDHKRTSPNVVRGMIDSAMFMARQATINAGEATGSAKSQMMEKAAYHYGRAQKLQNIYKQKGGEDQKLVHPFIRTASENPEFDALVESVDPVLLVLADHPSADKSEHPFTYCREVIIPAIESKGRSVDDPDAFCGWWKSEQKNASGRVAALKAAALKTNCGCQDQPKGEVDMDKKARVKALIDNPRSMFTADDAAMLEALPEARLTSMEAKLKTATEADAQAAADLKAAQDKTASQATEITELGGRLTALEGKLPKTDEDWMKVAPASVRAAAERYAAEEQAAKDALVGKLKTAQSAYTEDELKALSVSELEKLAKVAKLDEKKVLDFSGRGAPRAAQGSDDAIPAPPDMNERIRAAAGKK